MELTLLVHFGFIIGFYFESFAGHNPSLHNAYVARLAKNCPHCTLWAFCKAEALLRGQSAGVLCEVMVAGAFRPNLIALAL
jgi:hypothetical protein